MIAKDVTPVQVNATTFASATRIVTENAVNNMLNVIRASFMPAAGETSAAVGPVATVGGPPVAQDENAPLKRSSASRGRGIIRGKRN